MGVRGIQRIELNEYTQTVKENGLFNSKIIHVAGMLSRDRHWRILRRGIICNYKKQHTHTQKIIVGKERMQSTLQNKASRQSCAKFEAQAHHNIPVCGIVNHTAHTNTKLVHEGQAIV